MSNLIKVIALFGESGSGKDTIQKKLMEAPMDGKKLHEIISCTTRPPRDYEVDGVDYHFLSEVDFAYKVLDGSMLEATSFREWFYGTPIESLDKEAINIGAFNVEGIEALLEDSRLDVIPVKIVVDEKERLFRILNREKNPNCSEVCRRFLADEKDFCNIQFSFLTFDNNSKELDVSYFKNIIG